MSFRDAAIRATERTINRLGEPVLFQSVSGGEANTITAIFTKEYFDPELGAGFPGTMPVLAAKASDGPFNENDQFTIDALDETYKAVTIEPDADGQVLLRLERYG